MKEVNSPVNKRSVFISAGEQSGDMHASALMKELIKQSPAITISFSGLGGDMMIAQGLNSLYHIKDLATVGFIDVIKKFSFFKNAIKNSAGLIKENPPDVVILVDYPGFNLRLAEEIRKFYNKKIIYYISPQLWAWHEKRVLKVKKYIDLMLVLFPFEVDFYNKYGVKAEFTGHPLIESISEFIKDNPKSVRKYPDKKVITVLPGSRKDEVKYHLPVIIESLEILKQQMNIEVNISIAPGLKNYFGEFKSRLTSYSLTEEMPYKLILNSDLVMTKAGTSTMECTLIGTPYLIFYKTFPLNYHLLKPIVKVDKLGIANILLKRDTVKEFIQNDFTPQNISSEAVKILTDKVYRDEMIINLNKVWYILGSKEASENAAKVIKQTAGI